MGGQAPLRQTGTDGCSISAAALEYSKAASYPSFRLSSGCQYPSSGYVCTWLNQENKHLSQSVIFIIPTSQLLIIFQGFNI